MRSKKLSRLVAICRAEDPISGAPLNDKANGLAHKLFIINHQDGSATNLP